MAHTPSNFAPTAAEFVARPASIDGAVLDATIVTHSFPDMDDKTLIVGILAVPDEKSGPESEGWHIRDYLAIKTLVTRLVTNPRAQVWLSRCDTEAVVKQNPSAYTHGSEHRVVSGASHTVGSDSEYNGTVDGQVPIVFEPNVEKIKTRFFEELGNKSYFAAQLGYQVLVVICGRTTLEQDIYLDGYDVVITSQQIRGALDTGAQVTVVTSSLTSAGWQINPFFNDNQAAISAKKPIDFLARQCGGIFSRIIADQFLGWKSPFINNDKFNSSKKVLEAHPGPAMPDTEQLRVRSEFSNKIHALLASRLFPDHYDHSFSFDTKKDTWTYLIGSRKNKELLETLSHIWNKLDVLPPSSAGAEDQLSFLGTAFGGNRLSQISHLKHLVQESFPCWPGYYTSSYGQNVRAEFGKFLSDPSPTDLDCHVIFSIVEYRMTSMILGDLLIKYAGLDLIWAQRCRDWDEHRYNGMVQKQEVSKSEEQAKITAMGKIHDTFPPFYIPPGRELNSSKLHHRPPPRVSTYLAVGLTLRYRKLGPDLDAATDRVLKIIQQLKDKQVQLLLDDEDLRKKGEAWWKSIEPEVMEFSASEYAHAANFVPPPPELIAQTTGLTVVQGVQEDATAELNPISDNAQDTLMAENEVQSPEQPATPSGNGGMAHDRSPAFEVEQSVSPEIKIETPVFKTNTPDMADILKANPALANADDKIPPHLRKAWKPKALRTVEDKPSVNEEINAREEPNEVSVDHSVIPEDDGVNEEHLDSFELHSAKPEFTQGETPKLEPPAATKPAAREVDKSLPPHLRGKGKPITTPSYH